MVKNGNSDLDVGPQTLVDIGRVMIEGMVKNLKKMIPVMVATFLGVWIFHTYVLVWINEGFRPGGTIYANILALSGSELTGTLFWMILAFIATATIVQVKKKGPDGFLGGFKDISVMVTSSKESVSDEYQALLAAGAGICLFVGWFLGNFLVSFLLAVVLLFALSAKKESLLILCTRIGYSDVKRNFSGEKEFCPLDMQRTVLVFTGGIGGFVIAGIMPFIITLILAVLAVGFSAYWYYNKNNQGKNPPGAVVAAGILFVILLCSFAITPVVADDGGGTEAGGTFEGWIASEGAGIAVIMGLPPAIGSVIGILIGILGVEGASAVVAAGGLGAGAAGAAGATSTTGATGSSVPETKIYGTGTIDDPARDEFNIGKRGEDGTLEPYPENKDKPREIWGKGTKDDPYRDYPGDEAEPEAEEQVIEKPPETPPEETVPEVPKEEPVPEPPKETPPEVPKEEPVPETPEQPQPPEVEPPKPPEPPVVPPPEPPAPPKTQPPEKQGPTPEEKIIIEDTIKKLEGDLQKVKDTWQKRKVKVAEMEKALKKYKKSGVKAIFKGAQEVSDAVSQPEIVIAKGVKEKMGMGKTSYEKGYEKYFGKEVKMKEIGEDMKKSWDEYEKLKNEVNQMPDEETLLEKARNIKSRIGALRKQLKGGIY